MYVIFFRLAGLRTALRYPQTQPGRRVDAAVVASSFKNNELNVVRFLQRIAHVVILTTFRVKI
jgi:hypothetical protein